MIDPGKMDRRVLFQNPVTTRSDSGQPIISYQTIINESGLWAMVHSDGGTEVFQADKKTADRRRVFVTRFYPEVTEQTTIVYNDQRFDIKNIEEIGRREGLSIKATWTQGQYDYPNDIYEPEPDPNE